MRTEFSLAAIRVVAEYLTFAELEKNITISPVTLSKLGNTLSMAPLANIMMTLLRA